ncbi:hypothetical protein [Pseudonocardia abyssalis]|uniref:SRPBCC family protein n=2 Tax=Pseudonocardia abyssalis TaxID=2792008 RepID=A0ABS6UUW2_9PSEU|nr:hypothetical protein [Pseudonocardia abyssalis]MBW0135643.1 hypothetical protein [Pseudonocardia abyssalis]
MEHRIPGLARNMADVGAGLLTLPLDDLPDIAAVQMLHRGPTGVAVRLQLSMHDVADQVDALIAWGEALPEPSAAGFEHQDYIRLEVSGLVGGVRVTVWGHLRGPDLNDTACFLSLPLDGETHRLSLARLRALARHRAERVDA